MDTWGSAGSCLPHGHTHGEGTENHPPIKNQVAMSLGFWAARQIQGLSPGCRPHVARPGLARTRVCPASGQLGPTLLSWEQRQRLQGRTKHRLQGSARNSLSLPCAGRGTRDEDMFLSWRVTTQAFIYWEFSANQIVRMSPTKAASLARGPISTAELHNLTARIAKTKLGQT